MRIYSRPHEWGRSDCVTAAADAFRLRHGIDPLAGARGDWASRFGASRLVREAGGFLEMCRKQCAAAGLRGGRGEPGEIGVVSVAGHFGMAAAFCDIPGWWLVLTENGFQSIAQGRLLESWRA